VRDFPELRKRYKNKPIEQFTPNIVGSVKALQSELVEMRAQGYAIKRSADLSGASVGGDSFAGRWAYGCGSWRRWWLRGVGL